MDVAAQRIRVGRRIPLVLLAVLTWTPALLADTPPPDPSANQAPRGKDDDAKMPEKDLMPKKKGDGHDLDGPFAFQYLRTLAGDWKNALSADGSGETAAVIKTTAGGSALMMTVNPYTEGEMVFVFHLDGQDLVADCYSPLGNQPRFKFDPRPSYPGKYFFVLAGGTGFDKTKDRHCHEFSIQFASVNHIEMQWQVNDGRSRASTGAMSLDRGGAAPNMAPEGK